VSQIDTFEAMLERGQDSDMLRYTLGNEYYKNKQFDKAIEHLRQAVELKPTYSTAWKLLARALAEDGQLQQALETFDTAAKVAVDNGDKQVEKEITVFRKRVQKQIDAAESAEQPPNST